MTRTPGLAEYLAPDNIVRLERAAEDRYNEAQQLLALPHRLGAVYLLGFSVEMCLTAAYFRGAGFDLRAAIDRDTRQRRMALARQRRDRFGAPLMNGDPHPLVGWARLLHWQRSASPDLSVQESQRLKEAIRLAELVYRHWRPELRYKIREVSQPQVDEVRRAATWFLAQRGQL